MFLGFYKLDTLSYTNGSNDKVVMLMIRTFLYLRNTYKTSPTSKLVNSSFRALVFTPNRRHDANMRAVRQERVWIQVLRHMQDCAILWETVPGHRVAGA
jgi:hypothetical protein